MTFVFYLWCAQACLRLRKKKSPWMVRLCENYRLAPRESGVNYDKRVLLDLSEVLSFSGKSLFGCCC